MVQFQVYLKAELGKLRNKGDAEWFLRSVSPGSIRGCRLPEEADALVKKFDTQEEVNAFVDRLAEPLLYLLAQACDHEWRRNGVFAKLISASSWSIGDVGVELIDLQQAEPRLAYLFQRNGFALSRVSADSELFLQKPYSTWRRGEPVAFSVCLAKLRDGRYCLFDGIHRAIQLAWTGSTVLTLCWAGEAA